jgi:hypothetical protein
VERVVGLDSGPRSVDLDLHAALDGSPDLAPVLLAEDRLPDPLERHGQLEDPRRSSAREDILIR